MNVVSGLMQRNSPIAETTDEGRWDLLAIIDVARRRGRVVLASLLVCLGLAAAYLIRTPASFTATAVLVTDTKQTPPSPSQVSSEPLIDPAVIESQIEMVKSQRIAADVVDRLRLDRDPEFAGSGPSLKAELLARLFGKPFEPPSAQARRSMAVDALIHKEKVTRTGHSYLAEIAVTTLDPQKSADIANAIADGYIQDQLDGRMQANRRFAASMKQRVEAVKAQADEAAAAADQFRREHARELDAAVSTGQASSTAEPSPGTVGSASRRLGELTSAADAARNDYEALQNRYVRVTQFMQQQSLPVTEARVFAAAQPPLTKSAPKSTVVLILAAVGGLVVGAGLAMARESLDRRIRWPHQVQQDLGLPLAGALPLVKASLAAAKPSGATSVSRLEAKLTRGRKGRLATLFDSRRPWCAATQTLRTIKLAIDQSGRRSQGVVVGLVSSWPGEGKSTLGHNLARMLAETGARVLVVDVDFHKPDLSTAFAPAADRGIADLVDGQVPLGECVSPTAFGFDLLSCRGTVPLHPFDLLGSGRMQRALLAAQQAYDYVIVDLPSLLTSIDPQAVAGFVDAFILVIDSGRTTVDDVEQALSTSEAVSSRLVATVLNRSRLADLGRRRALRGRRSALEVAA